MHTEPVADEGPQLMTFGVPVAEGAVINQFDVFNPVL